MFIPDRNPFESLRISLIAQGYKQSQTEFILERQPNTLVKVLKQLKPKTCQWLIFIDQFEELFTLCSSIPERKAFVDCLVKAVNLDGPAVKRALAMRADFLDRFGNLSRCIGGF